jgi:5'-3' exonuclease
MRIVQMDRRQRLIRDEAGVIARFGVAPTSISDYLALVGDAADGHPGLRGWGAKSTAAVLSRFNHLEGIPLEPRESRVEVMYPAALTKRGGLERLCADASGAGAIFEGMARAESTFESR